MRLDQVEMPAAQPTLMSVMGRMDAVYQHLLGQRAAARSIADTLAGPSPDEQPRAEKERPPSVVASMAMRLDAIEHVLSDIDGHNEAALRALGPLHCGDPNAAGSGASTASVPRFIQIDRPFRV